MKLPKIKPNNPIVLAVLVAFVVVAIAVFGVLGWYGAQLRSVSSSQQAKLFVVSKGETVSDIAVALKKADLIRSTQAFEVYVKLKGQSGKFQAGTYALSPSQDVKSITSTLTKGKVTSILVTILPGKRIDQIRAQLINDGFTPDDVDNALDPSQYSNLPILAYKPANVITLEGLLWPDSFQKDQTTTAVDIIKQSLIEMGEHITPAVQSAFASHGLNVYQGITLASIIEQEVSKPADQNQVAQVFYTRMQKDITLGSDVTARYGAISAGLEPSLTYDSPYNTLIHKGLPPTPISNINVNSLNAAMNPANTKWLFFVAGDDGTTHFSTNLKQHEAYTAQYCHKLCSQ